MNKFLILSYHRLPVMVVITNIRSEFTANVSCPMEKKSILKIGSEDPQYNFDCCLMDDLSITERNTLINVTEKKGSQSEVNGFFAVGTIVKYFPAKIIHKNDKILYLTISNCQLCEIRAKNFQNFTELLYLNLTHNHIKFLEKDLFMHCPKIERIHLDYNQILFVDSTVFKERANLFHVSLENNHCCSITVNGTDNVKYFLVTNEFCFHNSTNFHLLHLMLSINRTVTEMANCVQNFSIINSKNLLVNKTDEKCHIPAKSDKINLIPEPVSNYATFMLLVLILVIQLCICCSQSLKQHICTEQNPQKGSNPTVAGVIEVKKQTPLVVAEKECERKCEKDDVEVTPKEDIYSALNESGCKFGSVPGIMD